MNCDLKMIKKYYGEEMGHLCRTLFPTILEKKGLLFKLISDNFAYSHELYNDIISNNLEQEFENYIYQLIDEKKQKPKIKNSLKSPEELLKEAGYILYECKSEKNIQKFKKYYYEGEELCTFRGGRLKKCFVFFAVKNNVDEIKRENFPNPKRQDQYGTSVISIQFMRNKTHVLSIKNRYNHKVNNCDTTFSNNLDNIIEGLTDSFANYYGLKQLIVNTNFELPNYVKAIDGKYYKYNYEINNIYYCPNNIIIDKFKVKKFNKDKFIILDYFILDMENKQITLYDKELNDCFVDVINNIQNIKINKEKDYKQILIKQKNGNNIIIKIDKENNIIALNLNNIRVIGDNFMRYNISLISINLPNTKYIGECCLQTNIYLERMEAPKLKKIGDWGLSFNENLKKINLPSIIKIGDNFLNFNKQLVEFNAPKLMIIGNWCLSSNKEMRILDFPNLIIIGYDFLAENNCLKVLKAPKVRIIENSFLESNNTLKIFYFPNLIEMGEYVLKNNQQLEIIYAPKLKMVRQDSCKLLIKYFNKD